jgi:tetratricopeptide (TPR) repeat protein
MKTEPLIAALLCASVLPNARAEPQLLEEARRALAESIPAVSVQKCRAVLKLPALKASEQRTAILTLGEALLRTGQFDEALQEVAPLVDADDQEARLLQADIFAASGQWSRALPVYRALTNEPAAPPAAFLGQIESLHALGQTARAVERLEELVRRHPDQTAARLRLASLQVEAKQADEAQRTLAQIEPQRTVDRKWKQFIEARLLLLADRPDAARVAFEEIVRDENELPENLLVGATLGIAEARIIMNGYEAADQVLESFINRYADSSLLELVFARLDHIYNHQDDPPESELQKWTRTAPPRRAALARYYLARLQLFEKKYDKAGRTLDQFIATYPGHSLLPYVHLLQADLALARDRLPQAIEALEAAARHARTDELRAEIELRTGYAHHRSGDFFLASKFFDLAARRSSRLRETALFDGALSALQQRNWDRYFEQYQELSNRFPQSALRAELILEQGLAQARANDPRAPETIELFLHHFPRHARAGEAQLALAELHFAAQNIGQATKYLQVVNTTTPSPETSDHADYLAIFLADAQTPRNDARVIELCRQFIRDRPKSPLLAEVRMKLGQVFFRNNDFPNAETQFVTLATESPESAYAEPALFLAGQSAMKTFNVGAAERALDLFDQVVKRNGALKLNARLEQAVIKRALGKEREAIALYDIILVAQPPPDISLRAAAICGKADNLLALGAKDPPQVDAAIAVYDELAASAGVPPVWRNQALYKKAKALEQQSRTDDALATHYDVLNRAAPADREFFWFYKAGFDAARILEGQEQWRGAIGIYEKMAALKGPRTVEALERIRELRLEKFIWE